MNEQRCAENEKSETSNNSRNSLFLGNSNEFLLGTRSKELLKNDKIF